MPIGPRLVLNLSSPSGPETQPLPVAGGMITGVAAPGRFDRDGVGNWDGQDKGGEGQEPGGEGRRLHVGDEDDSKVVTEVKIEDARDNELTLYACPF